MLELQIETRGRNDFVPVSAMVQRQLHGLRWMSGSLTLFVPHTTAGITIQENADPDVLKDLELCLERMVPWKDPCYRHFEGNTAAHMKASLLGSSVQVLVEEFALKLGRWQEIYFADFDGPRSRQLWVSFQGYVRK
jgi:secondary thiamine-phosphate synthase enzyme